MTILDEIDAAAEEAKVTLCRTCRWLLQQPDDERVQWEEALADLTRATIHIHTAMVRRGFGHTRGSLDNHRAGHTR